MVTRLKRQEILDRDRPAQLWAIIDEAVLRRPVGGAYVMREQMSHLIQMAAKPHVSVQVIPATGMHRGMWAGGFALADCEGSPTVGYQDTASQGQYVELAEDVTALIDCWDTLVKEALPLAASQSLLEEVAKSWTATT